MGRNPLKWIMVWMAVAFGLGSLGGAGFAMAAVNDIFPGEYVAPPENTQTLTAYAYRRELDGPYVLGQRSTDGHIAMDLAALRWVGYLRWNDYLVAPLAVLSWASAEVGGQSLQARLGGGTHGLADLRLGGTLWLREDRERSEFLGLTAVIIAPTGEYAHRRLLNIGENRWKLVLQGGWIAPLTTGSYLELTPELAFYSRNTAYAGQNTLEQESTWAVTGYLRQAIAPGMLASIGAQANGGGVAFVNGTTQNNPQRSDRVMAAITLRPSPADQWIIRYGKDTRVQNGFALREEWALRYSRLF